MVSVTGNTTKWSISPSMDPLPVLSGEETTQEHASWTQKSDFGALHDKMGSETGKGMIGWKLEGTFAPLHEDEDDELNDDLRTSDTSANTRVGAAI